MILRVASENVGYTWLRTGSNQRQKALFLKQLVSVILPIAKLFRRSIERISWVRVTQAHGHVHVVCACFQSTLKDALHKLGLNGIHDVSDFVLAR